MAGKKLRNHKGRGGVRRRGSHKYRWPQEETASSGPVTVRLTAETIKKATEGIPTPLPGGGIYDPILGLGGTAYNQLPV